MMRDFSGDKAAQLGQLSHGVTANQALINESNQYQHSFQNQQNFEDFRAKNMQRMQPGKNLAAEFNRLHVNPAQRAQGNSYAAEFNQLHAQAPMQSHHRLQQLPMMPQMRMPMMPRMAMPPMMPPTIAQVQPTVQPAPVQQEQPVVVEQKEEIKEVDENLDMLQPTVSDKKMINKLFANADPKMKQSKFFNFLEDLKNRPAVDEGEALDLTKESWLEEYNKISNSHDANWESFKNGISNPFTPTETPAPQYQMSKESEEYADCKDPFEEGVRLMKNGRLTEAVKAFEACVKKQPRRSEAWRLLGQCHADNENESQAIAALTRCVEIDEFDLPALIQLGVCHTNDWNSTKAIEYLDRWISNHPDYMACKKKPCRVDSTQYNAEVLRAIELFEHAAMIDPQDDEVHSVLGVLHNLSREYDKAEINFKNAIRVNDKDPSLWNKLGATMANGGKCDEAISAYKRALKLKPNYVRALSNLGISFANQQCYKEACVSYLASLAQNPEADNVWRHLKMSLHAMNRVDLVEMCKMRDTSLFKPHFNF
jgi:tetratricopeptide (TPR) repeat protein